MSKLICQSNRIKKLPPLLINQLAAGEVVTRPASVVKELLENAIDAGATCIDIRITQGGMGQIEVIDNGSGIHPDDMIMAVTRYATSKVADVAGLQGIQTLGFRGEALAATAAVSRLTLISCIDDSGIGRELHVAGVLAEQPTLTPVVHQQGTTVRVQDLYFNVPARRRHLKSIATEFAHIEAVVKQLALATSHITIELWHNDKRRFICEAVVPKHTQAIHQAFDDVSQTNITGYTVTTFRQSLLARMSIVLPNCLAHSPTHKISHSELERTSSQPDIVEVQVDLSGLMPSGDLTANSTTVSQSHIQGVLLPIDQTILQSQKSNELPKLIYINGRLVQDRRITQTMKQCVSGLSSNLYGDLDLGYILFFSLPLDWLNVNVHPSKQTIKINNLVNILAHLQFTVTSQLQTWHADYLIQRKNTVAEISSDISFNKDHKTEQQNRDDECISNPTSHDFGLSRTVQTSHVAMPRRSYQVDTNVEHGETEQSGDSLQGADIQGKKFQGKDLKDSGLHNGMQDGVGERNFIKPSYQVLYQTTINSNNDTLCLIQTQDGLAVIEASKLTQHNLINIECLTDDMMGQMSFTELMQLMLTNTKIKS